jgi:hypothetical protein
LTYRKVDISSGVALCEIQSFLIDINSDNPPSTKCLGNCHTEETNWSSTENDADLISAFHHSVAALANARLLG